ncbi:MAG: FkbM family methyltransferase [Bradyrhizobium sp.]|nr:FkbM family methyltransferase [Bradyrhizobium sp.]
MAATFQEFDSDYVGIDLFILVCSRNLDRLKLYSAPKADMTIELQRVQAIHLNWRGFLQLSANDMSVVHEGPGSRGSYTRDDDLLTVIWDGFGPDVFKEVSGVYIHTHILKTLPDAERLFAVKIGGKSLLASRIRKSIPMSGYEVDLRPGTSDIPTVTQVFVRGEYDSPHMLKTAATIVDLGANIGLATVFFALKYPSAKILSVEPDDDNFALLESNTKALGDRIQREQAAAWMEDGRINIYTESEDGVPLGAWGIQVSNRLGHSNKSTKCSQIPTLLSQAGFEEVDILKVDIEGAELELFAQSTRVWLPKIKLLVVETHDRFRPGSEEAVRHAVNELFDELPMSGENLVFRRRSAD